ncbi:hypothetical protein DKT75_05225 [Leucothrix arctica]|uniref:Uncharacterized protein n=1 Tax=Leucothrix arctica TaxID=1481894 RepID=A0A317CNW2_9GAMM|nr:hypothetical protein DKT75_05225 [Leucothrix arctica]
MNCFHGVTIRYYYLLAWRALFNFNSNLVAPKLLKTLDKWGITRVFTVALNDQTSLSGAFLASHAIAYFPL